MSEAAYDDEITYIDLTQEPAIELGHLDGSALDMDIRVTFGDGVHVPTLSERIGMYHFGNVRQNYMLHTDRKIDVQFEFHFAKKSNLKRLFWDLDHYASIPGSNSTIEHIVDSRSVTLKFAVNPPFSMLRLSAPWHKDIHYIDQIKITSGQSAGGVLAGN